MPVDPEYLRQLYGSLSDEALREVNRAELVAAAQKYYDAEVVRRELDMTSGSYRPSGPRNKQIEADGDPGRPEEPAFLAVLTAETRDAYIEGAFEVLQVAGIPCSMEFREIQRESPVIQSKTMWALLVPERLYLQATNILELEIYNHDFEAIWSAHLERLSDRELLALKPEQVWCGLFDRVERVTRAYIDELARRRIKM